MKWIGTQTIYDHVRLIKGITLDSVSITTIQSSGESFVDNDTSLMTSAAVADKIEAYGYSTTAGDITGVTAGTGLSGGGTSGAVTLNVDAAQTQVTSVGTITTGTWNGTAIAHAYIGADAIDGDNIGDDVINSEHYVDGSIDTAHIGDDQVTYAKIQDVSATDRILGRDTSGAGVIEEITPANLRTMINVEDGSTADQSKSDIDGLGITTVGTVDTGVWQGTAVASAYLDADTMHYSAQRQITHHSFADDIDTTKHYIGFTGGDQEAELTTGTMVPLLAPVGGKLLKIFLRSNKNLQTLTFTWRLETQAGVNFGTGPSIVGTQSGVGCRNSTMTTYDFTTGLDSGDNLIDAGDMVYISIESDGTTALTKFYMTCLWEWDLS